MSFDAHLIHTCTIENPSSGGLNTYGNSSKAWEQPVVGVPCRLVETRENVWSDEYQESVVQSVYTLMLGSDADVQERAKISQVTLEDRNTIDDTFTVKQLLVRRGKSARHKTATLERIS